MGVIIDDFFFGTGITNARFVCGKVESVIKEQLLMQFASNNIIGILDPPRAGVRKYVILIIGWVDKVQI